MHVTAMHHVWNGVDNKHVSKLWSQGGPLPVGRSEVTRPEQQFHGGSRPTVREFWDSGNNVIQAPAMINQDADAVQLDRGGVAHCLDVLHPIEPLRDFNRNGGLRQSLPDGIMVTWRYNDLDVPRNLL